MRISVKSLCACCQWTGSRLGACECAGSWEAQKAVEHRRTTENGHLTSDRSSSNSSNRNNSSNGNDNISNKMKNNDNRNENNSSNYNNDTNNRNNYDNDDCVHREYNNHKCIGSLCVPTCCDKRRSRNLRKSAGELMSGRSVES